MTIEKLEKYKTKLQREKFIVSAEIRDTEKPVDFGDDVDHFEEEGEEAEEISNQVSVGHVLKERLNDIDIALGKIETGKYGICEKCRKEIEEEILDIDPESRFCKQCKTLHTS